MRVVMLGFIALSWCSSAWPAWYLMAPDQNAKAITLTDKGHPFKVGSVDCAVGPIVFTRVSDQQIMEWRRLICVIDQDTQVEQAVECRLPNYQFSNMGIRKLSSGEFYGPILACGPEGRPPRIAAPKP